MASNEPRKAGRVDGEVAVRQAVGLFGLSLLSCILSIVSFSASAASNTRPVLGGLLLGLAAILAIAAGVHCAHLLRAHPDAQLAWALTRRPARDDDTSTTSSTALRLSWPSAMLLAVAYGVVFQVFVRLVFSPRNSHFQGRIEELDFGDKCPDLDEGEVTGGRNRAFDPEFNSFGHWLWGAAAIFTWVRVRRVELQVAAEYLSVLVIVYPGYNLIKRAARSDVFSRSSFGQNSCEWAFGVLYGTAVGALLQAATQTREVVATWHGQFAQVVSAGLLWCVSVALSVLMINTWDDACNDGDPIRRDPVRRLAAVLLVAPPIAAAAFSAYATRRWHQRPRDTTFGADGKVHPSADPSIVPPGRSVSIV